MATVVTSSQRHQARPHARTARTGTRPSRIRQAARAREMAEMVAAARAAGLRYVSDDTPGIRRKRAGTGFTYIGLDGAPIRDKTELRRIRALGIPPAWTDVWICPNPRGHIQATGRDAKGRKQYRYHPAWSEARGEAKYERMIGFARALPLIRERVQRELDRPVLSRARVLATAVRLLDETLIRVGNREYARTNDSYGLTTLRNEHADVAGGTLRLRFRGKSGKTHEVEIHDRRAAAVIRRTKGLPGQALFEYLDDEHEVRAIASDDVNEFIREAAGDDFTAKDFRTWGGTVVAARTLKEIGDYTTQTDGKHNVTEAIKAAAAHLGNTAAIAKKSYVHPGVVEAYMDHLLTQYMDASAARIDTPDGLRPDELEALALLQRLAEQQAAAQAS